MAQDFYSLFSPYGGYQTDEELLYDNPMLMAGLGGGAWDPMIGQNRLPQMYSPPGLRARR